MTFAFEVGQKLELWEAKRAVGKHPHVKTHLMVTIDSIEYPKFDPANPRSSEPEKVLVMTAVAEDGRRFEKRRPKGLSEEWLEGYLWWKPVGFETPADMEWVDAVVAYRVGHHSDQLAYHDVHCRIAQPSGSVTHCERHHNYEHGTRECSMCMYAREHPKAKSIVGLHTVA